MNLPTPHPTLPSFQMYVTEDFSGIAFTLHNCPMTEYRETVVPALKLTPEMAEQIGMNMIYLARSIRAYQQNLADSSDERIG